MVTRTGALSPAVVYLGLIALAIISGIGEFFKVVPSGTTAVIIGGALSTGGVHAGFQIGQASMAPPAAAQPPAQASAHP